jgi:anti-anti-sigma factor
MGARLTIRDVGDVIVIDAYGKLASGEGSHSLHAQLRELAASGHSRILLKVSGVPSLDTADIGELMAGYAAVTMAGGELKLLNPRDRVEVALRTTRIDRLLNTYVDEVSALRSFTGTHQPPPCAAAKFEPPSEWYYG